MFVVVKGAIAISQRDGLGNVAPITRLGRGEFTGEVAQLSGKPGLVEAYAEEEVEALLVAPEQLRALIIAEADLGERIVRALILRRVALFESGASGPVLIGAPQSPDLLRLQNFLRRNAHPHHVVDALHDGAALFEQYGAAPADVLVICPNSSVMRNPSKRASLLPRILDATGTTSSSTLSSRRSTGLATAVYAASKACTWSFSTAGRSAARRRQRAHRKLPCFPTGTPAGSPAAPS
jgi:thioredoxin reductase (NADPH)